MPGDAGDPEPPGRRAHPAAASGGDCGQQRPRGALIDDEALQEALRSGQVAAAGLDAFNGEPDIHPGYRELDNTFLLPHIGSATRETRDAMGFRALDNLDAIFAGREPADRVA